MATLAAQIETDIQILIASAHLIDLTNQRDSDASINSALLTRTCELAAAFVKRYLGAVTSTDDEAVEIGVRYVALLLKGNYSLVGGAANNDTRASIVAELKELVEMRGLEADVQIGSPDFGWVDKVYPGATEQQIDNPDNHD